MRNPNRIFPLMAKVIELWTCYPDMRFGQFMDFVKKKIEEEYEIDDWFYLEDNDIQRVIEDLIPRR